MKVILLSLSFLLISIIGSFAEEEKSVNEPPCPSKETIEQEIINIYKNPTCSINTRNYQKCLELFRGKIEQYKIFDSCLDDAERTLRDFYTYHKEYELAFGTYLRVLNLKDTSNSGNLAKILISLKGRANHR